MWFEDTDIRLRALEPEDLDWLYTLENDETLWGVGCSNVPYSRYALKSYIAESRHDIYADGQLRLVAVLKATGAVVGCVDLVDFSKKSPLKMTSASKSGEFICVDRAVLVLVQSITPVN